MWHTDPDHLTVLEHLLSASDHTLQEVDVGLIERRQEILALSSQDLIEVLLAVHRSSQIIAMHSSLCIWWIALLLLLLLLVLLLLLIALLLLLIVAAAAGTVSILLVLVLLVSDACICS